MCTRYIFVRVTKEMPPGKFLPLTFLVVLGDVTALPVVAARADMLETIDMAALEAGGLDYSAVTEPPKIKELEQVSKGRERRRPLRMTFCSCSAKH